jgi:2-dehydropantoate 2-reductase
VVQLQPMQSLTFGERDGALTDRVRAIAQVMDKANFGARSSDNIVLEMWEKWVFLASLAAATCLMRASSGQILAAPGGRDFILGLLDECTAVASADGNAPRAPYLERVHGMLTAEGSQLTASMFRDIKAGAPVEADHVIGDLIARADAAKVPVPKLRTAYTHLKAYERQRNS